MVDEKVRQYLSQIGRRGGQRSRRTLDSESARKMVLVREARRAFRRFASQCFWSCDPGYVVTAQDIPWIVEQLMKHGNREAWEAGARLCR
ncbi:MAG: hypothetical protein JXR83_12660 [Deltaproteobacteria bacterium]|nr:hypothetical protein [Deltaproteobacteria bacterium]